MLKDLYLCRTSASQIKGSCGHRLHHQLKKKQKGATAPQCCVAFNAGENSSLHAGVQTPTTGLPGCFFPLDGDAGLWTMQLCFGAAQLCSFCCHVGEMGQPVQHGMLAGAGSGHSPATPVMEEPS